MREEGTPAYEQGYKACSPFYDIANPYMPGSYDAHEWDKGMAAARQAETDRIRDQPRDYIKEGQGL